jgi:subtilase family serine protease
MAPFGNKPFNPKDPAQTGFAGETALDVEWAHVMAPDAAIVVIQANPQQETVQGQLTALMQATQFAVQQNIGSVISMSFGTSEQCLGTTFVQQMHAIFQQARAQKQTVLASAGDNGSGVIQCNANGQVVNLAQGVNYPASDPLVTSVGGTTLMAGATGIYQVETTWNGAQQGHGATGGGSSAVFAQPVFQQNLQGTTRQVSDLSFDADPLTGVPVVTGSLMPGTTMMIPIGGTSLGAPAIAGMVALFDQAAGGVRLGFLNSSLYRISQDAGAYPQAFHDIQSGNNAFVFQTANGTVANVAGFDATANWDPPTGVGTPNAANLVKILPQFVQPNDGSTL